MNGRKNLSIFKNKTFFYFYFKRPELVQIMRSIGNKMANSIWEANIKNRVKPQPNALSYVLMDCFFLFFFELFFF